MKSIEIEVKTQTKNYLVRNIGQQKMIRHTTASVMANILIILSLVLLLAPAQILCSMTSDMFLVDAKTRQSYPVDTDDIDPSQGEEVEEKILQLLGLPDKPRPSYKHLKENAAPQFMMHLYQEIQKQEGLEEFMPTKAPTAEEIGPEYRNLTYQIDQNKQIDGVDIVISFVNQRMYNNWLCYRSLMYTFLNIFSYDYQMVFPVLKISQTLVHQLL